MRRCIKGLLLIAMMFGHNYVLNQPQALQKQLERIHQLDTVSFNYLYSIPSAVSIIFIIPLGILYDRFSLGILLSGAFLLLSGQVLVTFFGPLSTQHAYSYLMLGRIFEGVGSEVLYMIQGNLASTWMGKLAGLIFILPEVGQIGNVFGTTLLYQAYGIELSLYVGLCACIISFIACIYLYIYLKKKAKQQIQVRLKQNIDCDFTQNHVPAISNNIEMQSIKAQQPNVHQLDQRQTSDQQIKNSSSLLSQAQCENEDTGSIVNAGKVFWLMIIICAINECLYFPFLDNANQLLQQRFCIPYDKTGFYLSLPFISAIIVTAIHGQYTLHLFERKKLIFFTSIIPVVAHGVIYSTQNCVAGDTISYTQQIMIAIGLCLFGSGIGSYYAISFPAVGYSVPQQIRGTAYACLCFFQTLSMTIVPIFSGFIIQQSKEKESQGYKNSSLLFVLIACTGMIFGYIVKQVATQNSFDNDDTQEGQNLLQQKKVSNVSTQPQNSDDSMTGDIAINNKIITA